MAYLIIQISNFKDKINYVAFGIDFFTVNCLFAGSLAGSPPLRLADRQQPQARDCQDTIQQGQPHHDHAHPNDEDDL